MTRLEKINHFRRVWGWKPLPELPDLGQHCEVCGTHFTASDQQRGRCAGCDNTICAASKEQLQAWKEEQ